MERIKAIVDYALEGNLTEMRDTLQAEMLDRVQLTLEELKKYVARNLLQSEEKENDEDDDNDDDEDEDDDDDDEDEDDKKKKDKKSVKEEKEEDHPDEKEDKKLVKKMVKKDALKEAKDRKDRNAHEKNMDAAQREMDRREAEGEDMSNHHIDPKTYEIKKKKVNEGIEAKRRKVVSGPAPKGTFAADLKAGKFRDLKKKFGDPNKKPKKVVGEESEQIDEKNWIAGAIKHKGSLHRELGVPEGKKIPEKELEKAAHASGKEGKRARLALTLKKMH